MSQVHPVREIITRADRLGQAFTTAHAQTIPPVLSLQQAYHQSNSQSQPLSEDLIEQHLSPVRDGLMRMEGAINEMVALLFHIDVFMNSDADAGHGPQLWTGRFDPKEALGHVSDLFHMYQAELLAKRESLSDLTCEDIDIDTFAAGWQRLDEVEQGKKQEVDDLADLLAGLG
ncbi:unnamed protein product [Tilletia controversa]|uniref:Uncharacterized protein n=3 Tax=Tilletia TaxID=13289 RepID=A0A8X7SSS4_9BASI|nr:hypothetical protein CF335_g9088 [Tilletia laevis]KAE8183931.1 hypothetical protein CF328_g8026 [Tilletia controversa]KAE8237706.1 hypothetical protein A4X03_0g9060 [Tilletia caries]KAE8182532.1 hypothetical protein CF336_g8517 [Tilletia laevis]KAE8238321.1 hypothetical protein A4X06_0g8866 [Tilletia controversa]